MATLEIFSAEGRVIHRSRNLRGLFNHARRTPITQAFIGPAKVDHVPGISGATLRVEFGDGSVTVATFASYDVCSEFVRSRRSRNRIFSMAHVWLVPVPLAYPVINAPAASTAPGPARPA